MGKRDSKRERLLRALSIMLVSISKRSNELTMNQIESEFKEVWRVHEKKAAADLLTVVESKRRLNEAAFTEAVLKGIRGRSVDKYFRKVANLGFTSLVDEVRYTLMYYRTFRLDQNVRARQEAKTTIQSLRRDLLSETTRIREMIKSCDKLLKEIDRNSH